MEATDHMLHPQLAEIASRARAEYLEMPGLQLTIPQAARLFNLSPDLCTVTLETLVADGFLHRAGTRYTRAYSGPSCS